MNWKSKLARAMFLLLLAVFSMVGAAWRYTATQAQQFPDSQIELRSQNAPQVGQPYVVDIYANIAAPAYGFGTQIQYDPTVLQLDMQQDADGTMVPLRVGGVFGSAQRIRNTQAAEGSSATLDAVYTLLPPAQPVQGESLIGRLTFTVLSDAPAQLNLVSPRLIALDNGTALDMPVVVADSVQVTQAAAAPVVADTPVTVEAAPVAQPAQPPVAEAAQVTQSVLATVDTPRDVLDQMARTSSIMNAVAIGLLVMMGLMTAVMMISTFMDALTGAKAQRSPTKAYAYANTKPEVNTTERKVVNSYRARTGTVMYDDVESEAQTMPSRTLLLNHLLSEARRRKRQQNSDQ